SYLTYVGNNKPETLIDASNSVVSSVDMELSKTEIDMFFSVVNVCYDRSIYLRDETNNTKIQGGDLEIVTDGEQTYATPHYGGDDPVSDSHGAFPYRTPLVMKSYFGYPIKTKIVTNTVSAYYDGGDVAREVDLGVVDANTTDPIYVQFDDFIKPNETVDPSAETIDHETIYLHFENSTSEDVSHYELWYTESSEWEWKMNVSEGGTYPFLGLEPVTNYSFRVVVVDDAGLGSDGLVVYNTTDDPINGTLNGTVYYSGGPLDGEMAENATVHLLNETLDPVMNETVNGEGYFEFPEVPFQTGWNYTVRIIPENAVVEGGEISGYTEYTTDLRFVDPTELNVGIEHYMIPTNGTLRGHLTLEDGGNATNATVIVLNSTMEEIASIEADMNGSYMIENLDFGHNYTIEVTPENAVEDGGTESGHIMTMEGPFNFTDDMVMNITVDLYTYTKPSAGQISGTIAYGGGPMDGDVSEGARVSLMDEDGAYTNTTTNETGYYSFEDVDLGNYTITVYPPALMAGETDVKSGYMMAEIAEFVVDSDVEIVKDVELNYYEYEEQPNAEDHPEINITDEDGEPIEGVTITVTVGEDTYTATTDSDGVAVFNDFDGTEFPADSEYRAEKDGYDTIEWKQGESVPEMKEEEETDNTLMYILIAAVVVILLVVLFLFMRKKGDDEEYEE
ncbi:MAG: fibronectin type III domain-containing protein, partial [Candidatus Thermoplasmatota archaeon]|nr:fibronectin type III domain-containing protein [Candidatus Thermoplasmatota archaeon]